LIAPEDKRRTKKFASAVAMIAVILGGSAAIYFIVLPSFHGASTPSPFEKTITETLPYGCSAPPPNASSTLTTSNSTTAQPPNVWGPLLGNFSSMTVEAYHYSSSGNSVDVSSFTVLSKNVTTYGTIYAVEIKQLSNQSNSAFNPTTNHSSIFLVSTNGSVFTAASGLNGNQQEAEFSFLFGMSDFEPIVSFANFSSKDASAINTTTVKIGAAEVKVTNYRHSSIMFIRAPCSASGIPQTIETNSNWTFQAAKILGTNYTLITEVSLHYSVESNSTSSFSSLQSSSLVWKVTSFVPE
jgi:hypothetical protein